MLPFGAMARSRGRVPGHSQAASAACRIGAEFDNSVIALASRTNPKAQKQSPIATESKSARKRHDSRRKKMLAGRVKGAGKCRDCACAAQADVISAIRTEIPSTRVQVFDRARIADDGAPGLESQDPFCPLFR